MKDFTSFADLKVAQAPDAEKTLLGCILVDNSTYFVTQQELVASDFYLSSHQQIYVAIGRLMDRQVPVDAQTLRDELDTARVLDSVGGFAYIVDLDYMVPRGLNVAAYARTVREKADQRRLQSACANTAASADGGGKAEELMDSLENHLLEIRSGQQSSALPDLTTELDSMWEQMEHERNRSSDILGLPSGIPALDLVTRGFQAGEVTIVGARTSVGKTSLLVQSAVECCQEGVPVVLFSVEMSSEKLLRRIVSAVSGVPFPRVVDPKWASDRDMQRMLAAREEIKQWPLYILDAAGIMIERLTAIARLYIRRHKVRLVGVDYLQIVGALGRDERLRIAAVSRALTQLAKDEKVSVVALSQLARPDRSSMERSPKLSDLRESSQIENDASVVILLDRPWDKDARKLGSEGTVTVAKNRQGETAELPIVYNRATLTFSHDPRRAEADRAA